MWCNRGKNPSRRRVVLPVKPPTPPPPPPSGHDKEGFIRDKANACSLSNDKMSLLGVECVQTFMVNVVNHLPRVVYSVGFFPPLSTAIALNLDKWVDEYRDTIECLLCAILSVFPSVRPSRGEERRLLKKLSSSPLQPWSRP